MNKDLISGTCEYRYVYHNDEVDDFTAKYGNWSIISTEPIKLESDFVEVQCKKSAFLPITNYNFVWSNVVPRNVGIKTNKPFAASEPDKQPSLIILGLDSMSLSNFIRQVICFLNQNSSSLCLVTQNLC